MRSFIFKILVLVLIVFAVNKLIRSTVPFYWHNDLMEAKIKALDKKKNKVNTLFLGSSKTRSAIDPKLFDKQVRESSNIPSKSFNLGVYGSNSGELFWFINHLLDQDFKNLQYIFLELRPTNLSAKGESDGVNLHTNRTKYWLNFQSFIYSIKNVIGISDKHLDFFTKVRMFQNYCISFIENQFNIGMMQSFLNHKLSPTKKNQKKMLLGENLDGFQTLDYSATHGDNNLNTRRSTFLKKSKAILKKKIEFSIATFENEKGIFNQYNKNHLNKLLELIKKCEAKGIRLIYLIPPLMASKNYYQEAKSLYNVLPRGNKIELCNASKYPKLHSVENLWDKGHLNHKGAKLYTKLLASKFAELEKKHN